MNETSNYSKPLYTDVMIDLETLGTTPQTPVISIGAVAFNPELKLLGPTFYAVLDLEDQLRKGRKPTANTISWWMKQSAEAQQVLHEADGGPPQSNPVYVLADFNRWYATVANKAYAWGNGSSFDISIMEDILRDYGLLLPWGYNQMMDLRTFKRIKAPGKKIVIEGTAHNALDDAISQAKFVLEHW